MESLSQFFIMLFAALFMGAVITALVWLATSEIYGFWEWRKKTECQRPCCLWLIDQKEKNNADRETN